MAHSTVPEARQGSHQQNVFASGVVHNLHDRHPDGFGVRARIDRMLNVQAALIASLLLSGIGKTGPGVRLRCCRYAMHAIGTCLNFSSDLDCIQDGLMPMPWLRAQRTGRAVCLGFWSRRSSCPFQGHPHNVDNQPSFTHVSCLPLSTFVCLP